MVIRSQRLIVPAGVVRLRPLARDDHGEWRRIRMADEEVRRGGEPTTGGDWDEEHSRRNFRAMLRRNRAAENTGVGAVAAIELDGDFVGQLTLGGMRPFPESCCWAGYWVSSEHWGGGVATAALALACDHATALGLRRIEATVLAANDGSRKVLERCGFREIGVARELFHIDGAWRDHVVLDRLADGPGGGAAVDRLVSSGFARRQAADPGE